MAICIKYKKYGVIPLVLTWFNKDVGSKTYDPCVIHIFRQSTVEMEPSPAVCIKHNIFHTTAIDLTQSMDQIWNACEPKSCRYEIRKIQKMVDQCEDIKILENVDLGCFLKVANNYIKIKKYTKPIKQWSLEAYLKKEYGTLMSVYYNG
jgi:hypothetical protein